MGWVWSRAVGSLLDPPEVQRSKSGMSAATLGHGACLEVGSILPS